MSVADLLDGSKTWAMQTGRIDAIVSMSDDTLRARSAREPFVPPPATRRDGAMVIPIVGPLTRWPQRGIAAMLFGGGTAVEDVRDDLRAALADPGVSRIVLHIDSPGGETDGITELAREIYDARSRKPITAFVDSTAASAAYWLASQADHIVVTPSGEVGSIGVFALHLDRSKELEAAGIVPTFIQAGRYKTEENPLAPLSDDALSAVQKRVDDFYKMFTTDVARGRGVPVETVRSSYGEGRMVLARDAVRWGMADEVGTIRRAIASRATASAATGATATDEDVPISVERADDAVTYIETRYGGPCEREARDAFDAAVIDLGLQGREPNLHFFRAETDLDRQLDRWSPRMRWAERELGVTVFDRESGAAAVWVNATIEDPDFMRHVVEHEVAHVAQPRALVGEAAEADAEHYATRSRPTILDELYGGRAS